MSRIPGGLSDPQTTTVPRRPRSVRRTSHIDMQPRGASSMLGLELTGRARDLATDALGAPSVVHEATVHALVRTGRVLESLETQPAADVSTLLGLPLAGGFRAAVRRAVPDHAADQTPLYLLLDDLPVAALIAGYADLYSRTMAPPAPGQDPAPAPGPAVGGLMDDICAGWAHEGTMMTAIREEGGVPTTLGPVAPELEDPQDPVSWHELAPLPPGAMRRRRLIDIAHGDVLSVLAMFRDTHVDQEGVETVLHEYAVEMDAEPGTLRVLRCEATPRVLPWVECPAAAASARRLEGSTVADARELVRREFKGTSTCTHLNDLLRSLADVAALVPSIPG